MLGECGARVDGDVFLVGQAVVEQAGLLATPHADNTVCPDSLIESAMGPSVNPVTPVQKMQTRMKMFTPPPLEPFCADRIIKLLEAEPPPPVDPCLQNQLAKEKKKNDTKPKPKTPNATFKRRKFTRKHIALVLKRRCAKPTERKPNQHEKAPPVASDAVAAPDAPPAAAPATKTSANRALGETFWSRLGDMGLHEELFPKKDQVCGMKSYTLHGGEKQSNVSVEILHGSGSGKFYLKAAGPLWPPGMSKSICWAKHADPAIQGDTGCMAAWAVIARHTGWRLSA